LLSSWPVLVVHGDSDRNASLVNFTRVEVFGSPAMNWVRVRVSEDSGRIRFFVTPGS
jgi:hypothetical protein